jgi:tetratricopeptide (TPR) repeat protein
MSRAGAVVCVPRIEQQQHLHERGFDMRPVTLMAAIGALLMGVSCCPAAEQPTAAAPEAALSTMPGMAHLPATAAEWAHGAMLFAGLGKVHRAITTDSPDAQRYFDQGMTLMWGFNHDEATRSFARAAQLDPHCAACYWGVSLTVGPNYNLPFLSAERAVVAYEALKKAQAEAARASAVEQALITALSYRYPGPSALDPASALPVQTGYAEAMARVASRFPDDLDVRTLYAESMMNLRAWKLWAPDGAPAPGTAQIVATLESVLASDPEHPGANHYYVHALEASAHPEKAVASAERLRDLVPGAGHLVHMPAHIFQRIGRYEDAAEANRRAVAADQRYAELATPPDYYPVMYTAHNFQFLAYSTAMEGRRAETISAVDRSRSVVSDAMLLEMPGTDWYVAECYTARVRFGLWDELLAMRAPDRRLPGLLAGYLFGRAMAQAATGRLADARETLGELTAFVATLAADVGAGQNALKDVMAIAIPTIEARIASAEGRVQDELACLRKAVTAEDQIAYDEPKNWFVPLRHVLGAALLRTGAAPEAEAVYREDLHQNPDNGWALYGLQVALERQGKRAAAAATASEYRKAWQHADVRLTTSAF